MSPQMLPMKLQVGIRPKFSARDRALTKWKALRGLDITDSPTLGGGFSFYLEVATHWGAPCIAQHT